MAVVVLTSALIVMVLDVRVDRSRRAQVLVGRLGALTNDERYQPTPFLYGRPVTAEGVAEHRDLRTALDDGIDELRALAGDDVARPLQAAADDMGWQASVLIQTAKQGRLEYAMELDHGELQHAYEQLSGALAAADHALEHDGKRARTIATMGIVAATLLAGLVNVVLARRHDRSQRGHHELLAGREAVAASEARFRALLENSTDVVIVMDGDFRVRDATSALKTVLGIEPAELIGRSLLEIVDPEQVAAMPLVDGRLPDTFSTAAGTIALRCQHADGSWLDLEAAYHDRRTDPHIGGVVVNARDVTSRKHLENDLRRSQRLESVGQLAAGIAHEINTPIQFVGDNIHFLSTAFADLQRLVGHYASTVETARSGALAPADITALEDLSAEIDQAFLFEEIPLAVSQSIEGIEQVARIVRAMKAFGHPSGEAKAPASLNDALQSTLIVARNEYKYHAEVHTHLAKLPLVPCHIGELNQVFLNLLVNAAHAIDDAKRTDGRKGSIVVATSVQGDHAVIAFADNGCGMPADVRDRIFEPFFTTKEVGRGTGQGLALAWSTVVDRHKGTLTVDSTVGEGTVFRIALPLRSDEPVVPATVDDRQEVPA
jgi:PAS domain S-box-containing protein